MLRVAAHLIRAVADAAMDKLTRVAILEGALGVAPWSLARGGTFALAAALEKIEGLIPDIDPLWLSDRDVGVYGSIIRGARDGGGSAQAAQDIAQDTISGLSRSQGVTGGQLYEVGQKLSATILAGGGLGAAKAMLSRHGKHRALQHGRGPKSVSLTRDDEDGGQVQLDIPTAGSAEELELLADLLEDEQTGNVVRDVLRKEFHREFQDAPAKMAIFDKWLADPTASATTIAREVGNLAVYESKGVPVSIRFDSEAEMKAWVKAHPGSIISATQTSKVLREIWDLARGFFKRHPELFRNVHLQQELSQLGYGNRSASERKEAREDALRIAAWIRVQLRKLRA